MSRARRLLVAVVVVLAVAACTGEDSSATAPVASPPPVATSGPRVLTLLIERNPWADQYPTEVLGPTRVYQTPGQPEPPPRFVVRPGEHLRMRVDNQDAYVHSLTLPRAGVT
jgi:hypothetical protein